MSEREVVRVFDCLCCVGSLRYFHLPLLAFDRFQRPEYGLCHAFLFAHGLVHLFCEALFEDVRIAVTLFPHFNGCEVQIHPFLGIAEDEFLDSVNFLAEEGYIHLRRISTKESAALADTDYTALEAKLTGRGIRLLAGGIEDDMIEV